MFKRYLNIVPRSPWVSQDEGEIPCLLGLGHPGRDQTGRNEKKEVSK